METGNEGKVNGGFSIRVNAPQEGLAGHKATQKGLLVVLKVTRWKLLLCFQ